MPQENNPSVINDYAKKRACRLLSLDAGHNGFCQIYFLQELFHRLKFDLHSEEEPRPCDWFDMIIGSGHGGLLAILLGRLCMPVSTALHTYHKLTKAITNKPTDDPNERKKNMQLFITAFTDVLKSIEFDKDTLLEENGTNRCKVIICVLDGYTNDGKHLRNFDFRNETGSGGTILEAACATIADLRSYNPVDVGDDSLCYNARLRWANPVQRLLRDAQITFGRDVNVSSIISVGPGERTEMNDSNSYGLIKDIIERIATDTEPPHQLMLEGRAGSAKIYTRHNSFCAQVHVNPAKAKSSVLSHLETYEGRKELDQAVSNLLNQEGKHSLKELNVNPLVGNGRESTQKDSRSVDMSLVSRSSGTLCRNEACLLLTI
ncbi:FabD/lysophospholipase-like protein [Serendipita vermifera]|nr:FabD/lysophospholipase-like protein [Serendipita vermifera]